MTTNTLEQLFRVALQDLREGRRTVSDRLPEIVLAVENEETRLAFHRLITQSTEEMGTLAEMLREPDGEPNLWASGIIDDACRDIESTTAGLVRDIAVIGAIRKFLAADIVSLETAIALAHLEDDKKSEALVALQQDASDLDHLLRRQLRLLTNQSVD